MLTRFHPISLSELCADTIGDIDLNINYIDIQLLRIVTLGANTGTNTAYMYNKENKSTNNVHYFQLLLSRSISSENTQTMLLY